MKKILTKKNIALLAVVFVLGLGASILYKATADKKTLNTTTSTTVTTNRNTDGPTKTDEGNPTTTVTTKVTNQTMPSVPADNSGLGVLEASLTATKSSTDDTISLAFYMEAGQFTVQEKVSGVWKATTENIFYPGNGGLVASELKIGEDTKVIRLYKIENGKYTKVSKEFTVVRAEVVNAEGIKTYN